MEVVFEKGKLYKVKHKDISRGQECRDFVALSDCIIFCPKDTIVIDEDNFNSIDIPCYFLVTFDMRLYVDDSECDKYVHTSVSRNGTILTKLNANDIEDLSRLCNSYINKFHLASVLKNTDIVYNRKLKKLIINQ